MQMSKIPKSRMHIFNVSITSVQSLEKVVYKARKESVTQKSTIYSKQAEKKWRSSADSITMSNFSVVHTLPKRHMHQCVYQKSARFKENQPRGMRGVDYTKQIFKTCWKNDKVYLHVNFSNNLWALSKCSMHIFNMSRITLQSFKNFSLKLWENLVTQSSYCLFKTCWENDYVQILVHFWTSKCRMHILNVSIPNMQSL
jgi:hypothetical protein